MDEQYSVSFQSYDSPQITEVPEMKCFICCYIFILIQQQWTSRFLRVQMLLLLIVTESEWPPIDGFQLLFIAIHYWFILHLAKFCYLKFFPLQPNKASHSHQRLSSQKVLVCPGRLSGPQNTCPVHLQSASTSSAGPSAHRPTGRHTAH